MSILHKSQFIGFLLAGLLFAFGAFAQAEYDALYAVETYRAQITKIMTDLEVITEAMNNRDLFAQAQAGKQYIASVSEDDWANLATTLAADPSAFQIPQLGELSNSLASAAAIAQVSPVNSMQSQLDGGFPEFGPGFPVCPAFLDDPNYVMVLNTVAQTLGSLLEILNFICMSGIPIPILGSDLGFSFICIGISIALGVVSAGLTLMGTCRLVNGRLSTPTLYDALVYPDLLLNESSVNLQTTINNNTTDTIKLIRDVETELNSHSIELKTSLISELKAALTAQQFSLVSDMNSNLASVENSVVSTTNANIKKMRDEVIQHTKSHGDAINANTNSKTLSIVNHLDLKTNAILANIQAAARETISVITRVGCEDLRLDISGAGTSDLGVCTNFQKIQSGSVLTSNPSTSAPASNAGPASQAAVGGGCSAMGSDLPSGNLLSFVILLMASMLARAYQKAKFGTLSGTRSLAGLVILAISFSAFSANAQSEQTVENFRAQYEEAFLNLKEYFVAAGKIDSVKQIDEGLAAMAQVTNQDMADYFAQVPVTPNGSSIPDFGGLVDYSRLLLAELPPAQAQAGDTLIPKEGFPPMGSDFCPVRTPNEVLYTLTVLESSFIILMSIMTYICLQSFPAVGKVSIWVCFALSIAHAVVTTIYSLATNCAFLEGGPPTYEALAFISADIENQFALLENTENLATNQIQTQLIDSTNKIFQTDNDNYVETLNNANTFINAEENYIKSDISTSMASTENSIVSTTTASLLAAKNAIKKNSDVVTASIIENANKRAEEILSKADLDANKILQNARALSEEMLGTILELGCKNIQAETGQITNVSQVSLCKGLPGF